MIKQTALSAEERERRLKQTEDLIELGDWQKRHVEILKKEHLI
jgi:hypothetical protein